MRAFFYRIGSLQKGAKGFFFFFLFMREITNRGELQIVKKAELTRDKQFCGRKLRAKPQTSIGIGKAKVIIRPRGTLAGQVKASDVWPTFLESRGSREERDWAKPCA
jgi:hypothetical protein